MLAVRQLAILQEPGTEARDLAAFIAEALRTISEGIDGSVTAWEKRGYWVKADKFRMDWAWTGELAKKMVDALSAEEWGTVAKCAATIAEKFNKIQVSPHHRLGKPWAGAYEKMMKPRV